MVTRTTHAHEGGMAIFLIGMTINQPWRPDRWLPTLRAMPPMIRELYVNKAAAGRGDEPWLGFMGAQTTIGARGPTTVQYWRSVEDIYSYASMPQREHRPAWQAFYERARTADAAVGIWHETYGVAAGAHESLYGDLAQPIGLAAATGSVAMLRRGRTAAQRISSGVQG